MTKPLGPGRPRKRDEVLSETVGYRVTTELKARFQTAFKDLKTQNTKLTKGDLFREIIEEGLARRGY